MSKLIMIDDNPLEHMVMQKMLDRYELFRDSTHSLDGSVIIAFLKENCSVADHLPDLIFLDLNMPDFSGWDFLAQFALLQPLFDKPISIYILSSSVDHKEKARALEYSFVEDFYVKPIKRAELENLYGVYRNTHRLAG